MIYLDRRFLAPLFRAEASSGEVEAYISTLTPGSLSISRWTRVEFASLMARDVRMGIIDADAASTVLGEFDFLAESALHMLTLSAADFDTAQL